MKPFGAATKTSSRVPGDLADSFGRKLAQLIGMTSASHGLGLPVEPGTYETAVVILLTDGVTTRGPDPLAVAQICG